MIDLVRPKQPDDELKAKAVAALHKNFTSVLGDTAAPAIIEIASHSRDHVLLNLFWKPEASLHGQRELNMHWIVLLFELGGSQGSYIPQGNENNWVQASVNISLERLLRGLEGRNSAPDLPGR